MLDFVIEERKKAMEHFLKYATNDCYTVEMQNYCTIAIHAIGKTIPMKPDYQADGYADGVFAYDEAFCPVCEHSFEYDINDWGSKYCPDCGQALDWSECDD